MDFHQHPLSTPGTRTDETIVPDTGICGTFRQPMHECPRRCGAWSMDARLMAGHNCWSAS